MLHWIHRIWSHLLKKSLRENFIFCAINYMLVNTLMIFSTFPKGENMFDDKSKGTTLLLYMYSKLTSKTPEWCQLICYGVFE